MNTGNRFKITITEVDGHMDEIYSAEHLYTVEGSALIGMVLDADGTPGAYCDDLLARVKAVLGPSVQNALRAAREKQLSDEARAKIEDEISKINEPE